MSSNIPSIDKGWMRFYSAFRPALFSNQYEVTLKQEIKDGKQQGNSSESSQPTTNIGDEKRYFDVTGPRFSLPKTEIHSVFPPANATGAFSQRLAHIALKRRTLPWERSAEADSVPASGQPPWLALVLLADGEGNFETGQTIGDLKSKLPASLVTQLNIKEEGAGAVDILEVTRRVVDAVFPAKKELPFLSHVRQVNIKDTEGAKGDEDGFMSVVLSNRLPQPGITYKAYLISLEGRLDVLPTWKTPPVSVFPYPLVYWDVSYSDLQAASRAGIGINRPQEQITDVSTADIVLARGLGAEDDNPQIISDAVLTESPVGTGIRSGAGAGQRKQAGLGKASVENKKNRNPWANNLDADNVKGQAAQEYAPLFVLNDMVFEMYDPGSEKLYFPVLASWTFNCDEGGDFEALMQNLDNGLLGKAPEKEQYGPQAPITDTGHTIIDHVLRRGEKTRSWYRGAFTPREVVRRLRKTPFFSADQARRIAEDGREDISDAAAFELGRLLALSDSAFAQTMATWRRSGFRVGRMLNKFNLLPGIKLMEDEMRLFDTGLLNRMLRLDLLKDVLQNDGRPLGPQVNPVDGAWTFSESDAGIITRGFNLQQESQTREMLGESVAAVDVDPRQAGGIKVSDFASLAADDLAFADLTLQLKHCSSVQACGRYRRI